MTVIKLRWLNARKGRSAILQAFLEIAGLEILGNFKEKIRERGYNFIGGTAK